MAKSRILAPWVGKEQKSAVYHCVSRVVERQFHFHKKEKERFVAVMRLYEEFCGVKILSFVVMSNHFHVMVEVPPRPHGGICDDDILERVALLQAPVAVEALRERFESYRNSEAAGELTDVGRKSYEELREKYMSRMWDLGKFMQSLKQQFSRWFNKVHERKGTLWEERYNSSLVEPGHSALVVSSYIDLNPVRAGIVNDPKNYRWSSYAESVVGGKRARTGIVLMLRMKDRMISSFDRLGGEELENGDRSKRGIEDDVENDLEGEAWRSIARRYRLFLYEEGREPGKSQQAKAVQGVKRSLRKGFTDEEIERERMRGGELGMITKVHCRTRAFIDGAVIGSRAFVEGVIHQLNQEGYWKTPRKTGPTRMGLLPEAWAKPRGKTSKGGKVLEVVDGVDLSKTLWSLRHLKKE